MTFQNRVAPDGSLNADPARGDFMGNRGKIHDPNTQILRRKHWQHKHWICCLTSFKDRPNPEVWTQGYTELFFLDEVTALAAGHRPCFECRRGHAIRFAEDWANSRREPGRARADPMDIVLHRERTSMTHQTLTFPQASTLPDGAVVAVDDRPFAVRNEQLLLWSFGGYGAPVRLPDDASVSLLTPPSMVKVLRAGYQPVWHNSAK